MTKRNFITRLIYGSITKLNAPLSQKDRDRAIAYILDKNRFRKKVDVESLNDEQLFKLFMLEMEEDYRSENKVC